MEYSKYILLFVASLVLISCKTQYKFNPPNSIIAETFQVNRFENNALLVEPGLENDFRIALQDLIQDQTKYKLTTSNADLVYKGEISTYRISPTTANSNDTAAQNRLTIGVKVKFHNKNNEKDNLEQNFSFFYDYDRSTLLTGSHKTTAHEEIFDRLTQDVINATLAKW